MTKSLSNTELLDFALEMFNEGKIQPQKEPISKVSEPRVPDISKITITNEQVECLLQNKPLPMRKQPVAQKSVQNVKNEITISKRDILEIVLEFKKVISQASNLIKEMTTVGSIGVNMAPTEKKKPKKKKQFSLRRASEIVKETLK